MALSRESSTAVQRNAERLDRAIVAGPARHAPSLGPAPQMRRSLSSRRAYDEPGPRARIAQGALHACIVFGAASLWTWHLGRIAAQQPIAQKYGWFSSYMTYDALTLQLSMFVLALIQDLRRPKLAFWKFLMDDFACALFGPAIFVTFSYYVTQFLPLTEPIYGDDYQVMNAKGQEQPVCYAKGICVPAWVPNGLHIGNSVAAVLDFLVCFGQRTFSNRAELFQRGFTLTYVFWLMVRKWRIGTFPYPFMEQLPYPWVGFVLVSIFMVTSCGLLFALGWTVRFLLARIFHLASLQHDSLNQGQRRRQELTATPSPHQQLLRRSRQNVLLDP